MSGNLAAIFEVLSHNSADVEEIVNRFGGVGNLMRASPALFRIAMTIAKAKGDPAAAAERASQALIYTNETRQKVEAFQKKYGLSVDGLIGDQTWNKVEQLLVDREEQDKMENKNGPSSS